MDGIGHGGGTQIGVAKTCKPRWISDKGQESMCVCVAVDRLDYMQCECNSEGTYMPNTCNRNKSFFGQWSSGPRKVRSMEKTTMC